MLEVTKATKIAPDTGSITMVAGPPGVGKSWFCGTMAEYLPPEEVLVLATLPREVNSLQYQRHDLDTIVIFDEDWRPSDKKLMATGFKKLSGILHDLRKDTKYSGIILDNGTEAAELAWHDVLAPLGVGDPNALGRGSNRFAPYTSLREKLEQMILDLALLTGKTGFAARPKLIAVPWHIQPPKDGMGDDESADAKGQGSEYEGEYLPMIRGSFRRRISALVDNVVYGDLVSVPSKPGNSLAGLENHYCIQVVSDTERHVKLAGVAPPKGDLVKGRYIDIHGRNDAWRLFMDLLEKSKED